MASDTHLQTYCTGPTPPQPGDILDGYYRRPWLRFIPSGNSYVVSSVSPAGPDAQGRARWRVELIRLREQPPRRRRILGGQLAAVLLLAVAVGVPVAWPGQADAQVLPYSHCARPAPRVRVCAWPVIDRHDGQLTASGAGSIRYRNGYAGLSALAVYVSGGPQAVGPAFGRHPRRHTQPAVVIDPQRVVVTVVAAGPWGRAVVRSWPAVVR
jgi:hypothetical protein